jgi:undecaprenyl-phosphate galactose phosphotransferase
MTTTWIDNSRHGKGQTHSAPSSTRHARYWGSIFGLALADGLSFLLVQLLFREGHDVPAIALFLGTRPSSPSTPMDVFAIIAVVFVFVRYLSGDYGRRQLFWDGTKITTIALIVSSLPDFVMYALGGGLYELTPVLASWCVLIVALPLMRQAARLAMAKIGIWQIPTAIIGINARTAEVHDALRHSLALGFDVRWLVVENTRDQVPDNLQHLAIINSSDPIRIASLIWSAGCKETICAAEDMQSGHLAEVTRRLLEANIRVAIIPSLTKLPLAGVTTSYFFGRDILLLQARSNVQRLPWRVLKRSFDIVVSTLLLILLSPLFLMLAIAIKRADPGSVLYSQIRIGRGGTPFRCLKLRTMVTDADARLKKWRQEKPELYKEYLKTYKLQDDPRITPIGRWLRKTSLDELPQLWNVLRGDMSLVGPRPVVAQELNEYYGPAAQLYIRTRPGMTGLWQVSGRSNTSYERRVILDEWYILNWSFWYDIVILIQTAWIVATRKGAV